jgi:enoyl-CoA hydratase
MHYDTIRYEKDTNLGIVTLCRPDRLNAISLTLLRELGQVVEEIRIDETIKVLILTGGPRYVGRPLFSAGADLKEITEPAQGDKAQNNFQLLQQATATLNAIENLPKPTIAAIDGICTTGALELALVFDMRFAGTAIQISDWHAKTLGSAGGWGLPVRLCRLIGPSRTKELAFTSCVWNAEEALRIGLVNRVFSSAKLLEETKLIASQIALKHQITLEINKVCVDMATQLDIQEAMHFVETQNLRIMEIK